MAKTTLPPMWWPLMELDDLMPGHCIACGRTHPTEGHHPVKRSAGELIDPATGKKKRKPRFELCGFGNNLMDADGNYYCHGLAHAGLLYFRKNQEFGTVELLMVTPEWRDAWEMFHARKFDYLAALAETDGWRPPC